LYHCGYLLASHLMYEDLVDVHVYCKQQGFFHLSKTEPVKILVLWKEVFPYSCNRSETANVKIPFGKRYLLLVGSRKVIETTPPCDDKKYTGGVTVYVMN
jgi:hypothetical protein